MAEQSLQVTSLDFDENKEAFKAFLKTQDQFKDYNFDGSNLSVILDILSYNTYNLAFYLNMDINEHFLDTAQTRNSIISHAKELGYVPRSVTSASVKLHLEAVNDDPLKEVFIVPAGTTFTGDYKSDRLTFTTNEPYIFRRNMQRVFAGDVIAYEGVVVKESFIFDGKPILIGNNNVDISNIVVNVTEDDDVVSTEYKISDSVFGLRRDDKVFFVQGAIDDNYEILFGNGIIGQRPKINSLIEIRYRISQGELGNNYSNFSSDGIIDGESSLTVTNSLKSAGGSKRESDDSIKYNAPRYYITQGRAITANDYENLLLQNFNEIQNVNAYGGEELVPPQYGKVYVAVALKNGNALSNTEIEKYSNFIQPRSSVGVKAVFIDPDFTFLIVNSQVKYDLKITVSTNTSIVATTTQSILEFANVELNNFNKTLYYSKLVENIDRSESSIISNETTLSCYKLKTDDDVVFGFSVRNISGEYIDSHGEVKKLVDTGTGDILVDEEVIANVDYEQGTIKFIRGNKVPNNTVISAASVTMDIVASKNTMLRILEKDIHVSAKAING